MPRVGRVLHRAGTPPRHAWCPSCPAPHPRGRASFVQGFAAIHRTRWTSRDSHGTRIDERRFRRRRRNDSGGLRAGHVHHASGARTAEIFPWRRPSPASDRAGMPRMPRPPFDPAAGRSRVMLLLSAYVPRYRRVMKLDDSLLLVDADAPFRRRAVVRPAIQARRRPPELQDSAGMTAGRFLR